MIRNIPLSCLMKGCVSLSYHIPICDLVGYKDVNIRPICARSVICQYYTAVQIKEKIFKMGDSQSPPENQLKRHVLVWVTATLSIKWKVNLGNLPADSEAGTLCIGIQTFKLNFQWNF